MERSSLINELKHGMELTEQLRSQLSIPSTAETRESLVEQILISFEKALSILQWTGPILGLTQTYGATTTGFPESPISMIGSPLNEDIDVSFKDNHHDNNNASTNRKMVTKCTKHVRVTTETGLEGSHDDGYSWRKYGQKDILAASYPRSYYRCTYRKNQNCLAKKQVQRSDEDPTIFEVTYRGTHTCSLGGVQSIRVPPEKEEQKQNRCNDNPHQAQSQEKLFSYQKSLRVDTEGLDNKEMSPPFCFPSTSFGSRGEHQSLSPSTLDYSLLSSNFTSFTSPPTPESNNNSVLPSQMNQGSVHSMQCPVPHFPELISANSLASNTIFDMEFSLDPVEIDPNFPFENAGFFP